jgi:hypothetical protein
MPENNGVTCAVAITVVGIVRCIEKLLIACASMSYDLCYDAV